MNHAKNTPGYDHRLQVAFSIKDGAERAWMLTNLEGRACFVSMSFEVARGYVEKDLADELPPGTVTNTQMYGRQVALTELVHSSSCCPSCAAGKPCEKSATAGILDVSVVGVQKTETVVAGRGRLVSGTAVREPLLAVAEGTENRVACCGGACEGAGTPSAIMFDRYSAAADGKSYELRDTTQPLPLPRKLISKYADRAPVCLPWVRVTRDPERFRDCLAAARALGRMDSAESVAKLVGEYLAGQDQEVFLVIMVDVQLQVRGISEIARGARDRVDIPVPDTLRIAIVDGASAIIVCHNHPTGVLKPSESDELLTKTLQEAADTVKINLLDHVIVGAKGHYSFADHGKLKIKK
jgi:DNA repair protein RadC